MWKKDVKQDKKKNVVIQCLWVEQHDTENLFTFAVLPLFTLLNDHRINPLPSQHFNGPSK